MKTLQHATDGILFLLDPRYADLIPANERFNEALAKAWEDGKLWAPPFEEALVH